MKYYPEEAPEGDRDKVLLKDIPNRGFFALFTNHVAYDWEIFLKLEENELVGLVQTKSGKKIWNPCTVINLMTGEKKTMSAEDRVYTHRPTKKQEVQVIAYLV